MFTVSDTSACRCLCDICSRQLRMTSRSTGSVWRCCGFPSTCLCVLLRLFNHDASSRRPKLQRAHECHQPRTVYRRGRISDGSAQWSQRRGVVRAWSGCSPDGAGRCVLPLRLGAICFPQLEARGRGMWLSETKVPVRDIAGTVVPDLQTPVLLSIQLFQCRILLCLQIAQRCQAALVFASQLAVALPGDCMKMSPWCRQGEKPAHVYSACIS